MSVKIIQAEGLKMCCRWCHYYNHGVCTYNTFHLENSIYKVTEEGQLEGVLKETLDSVNKDKVLLPLKSLLADIKIPKYRKEEIIETVKECINSFVEKATPELDINIDSLYQESFKDVEVIVTDPENFCCSHWR